jgi:hypothetical protein
MTDDNMVNLDEDKDSELDVIKELTIENNKMLHSMQRRARIGLIWKLIYWGFIIGATIGAFYFIQPYIDSLQDAYTGVRNTQKEITDFKSGFTFNSIKEYFTGTSTSN